MVAKVSVKGQTVIPEAIREQAHIRKGDELDVGYANGLIVMRKRQPLNASLIQSLLLSGSRLPDMTAENESAVARAIQRVRRKRKPCLRRIACSHHRLKGGKDAANYRALSYASISRHLARSASLCFSENNGLYTGQPPGDKPWFERNSPPRANPFSNMPGSAGASPYRIRRGRATLLRSRPRNA